MTIQVEKKILTRRGSKRAERVIDWSKSSTSVMFSGTANGELLPPYIVYKAENLYTTWTEGGPTGCRYNRSRSGWFDNVIFKDWFDTVVLPYFDKIDENQEEPTTKVMIGDNLSSHLSLDIIEKCKTHNIRFVMLPPNATHLCQPFDVAFFKGLKVSWRRVLTEWKLKNRGNLPKDKFPELLKKVLKELSPRSMINLTAGFRASGIYPFNPNEVTKRLPQDSSQSQPSTEAWTDAFVEILKKQREKPVTTAKKRKSKIKAPPGKSVAPEDFHDEPSTSRLDSEEPTEIILCDKSGHFEREVPNKKRKSFLSRKSESDTNDDEDSTLEVLEDPLLLTDDDETYLDDTNILKDLDELFDVQNEKENDSELHTKKFKENDFVLVKLTYNQDSKKTTEKMFIGKVKEVLEGRLICMFLRKSQKTESTYVFPHVEDVMDVCSDQIVKVLNTPKINRGRHVFEDVSNFNIQ